MFINESLRKTLHTKEDENYVTVIMKTTWGICYNYYRQFTYSIIITTPRGVSSVTCFKATRASCVVMATQISGCQLGYM
jgi:hypothetical protein